MDNWLLNPAVSFCVVFIFIAVLAALFSRLSYRLNKEKAGGATKSYACGEDIQDHMAQPDYSQFFPFAFFFTLAHVATLMLTTVPVETPESMMFAVIYSFVVLTGLAIVFRR